MGIKIGFVYENYIVGGCELLILRLAKAYSTQGMIPIVICKTIDSEMLNSFVGENITVEVLKSWKRGKLESVLTTNKVDRIITFKLYDYLMLQNYNKSVLMYAVHFKALVPKVPNSKVYSNLLRDNLKTFIYHETYNGRIIYMDTQTVEYTATYYTFDRTFNNQATIIRISIDDFLMTEEELFEKVDIEHKSILSISRAEFPFKEYLIGLIDWFSKESDELDKLTIVSYGEQIDQIKSKIEELDSMKRTQVHLLGKTQHNELEQLYKNANIYVGMGTTVVEAAYRGLISFAVRPYTDELIVDKPFYEDYFKVALDDDCECHLEKLQNALNSNKDQLIEILKNSRTIVEKEYGVTSNSKKIIQMFDSYKKAKKNYRTLVAFYLMKIRRDISRIFKEMAVV